MKFNEMTYTRPDIDALLAECKQLAAKAAAADSDEAIVETYYEQSRAFADYTTASNLANIHYTCDTRDAYWKAEQDFFDVNGPAVSNASVEISRAFLSNPHVDALTVADSLDAATDNIGRCYTAAKPLEKLIEELRAQKGSRYAPAVVELFDDPDFCTEFRRKLYESRQSVYLEVYRETI